MARLASLSLETEAEPYGEGFTLGEDSHIIIIVRQIIGNNS